MQRNSLLLKGEQSAFPPKERMRLGIHSLVIRAKSESKHSTIE